MVTWLILLIGVLLTFAFVARQRRHGNSGAWIGALAILAITVWVSSIVQPDTETSVPTVETRTVPSAQPAEAPMSEDVPRGPGAPMTPAPAQ